MVILSQFVWHPAAKLSPPPLFLSLFLLLFYVSCLWACKIFLKQKYFSMCIQACSTLFWNENTHCYRFYLFAFIFLPLTNIFKCFVVVSITLQTIFFRTDMETMHAAAVEACGSGEFMRSNRTSWAATALSCHIFQVQSFLCYNIFDSGK